MAERDVTCQVSCELCGWSTGATIIADERNVFEEILAFLRRCSSQHSSSGTAGKLRIVWDVVEPEAR